MDFRVRPGRREPIEDDTMRPSIQGRNPREMIETAIGAAIFSA
jgi:hypothetical protein